MRLRVFAVVSILAACKTTASDLKVANGAIVPEDHPGYWSAVQLIRMDGGIARGHCTGTLIAQNLVVSAAHCWPDSGRLYTHIRFVNHTSLDEVPSGELRPVARQMRHEEYEEIPEYDIGFLTFEGSLPEGYKPIEILPPSINVSAGSQITTVGFGSHIFPSPKLSASGEIGDVARSYWHRGIFSAFYENNARTIPGDSGGPTYFKHEGRWYLFGISSGDYSETWPLRARPFADRTIGPTVPDFVQWLRRNSGVELPSDLGPIEAFHFGAEPRREMSLVELCESRSLSRGAFNFMKYLVTRVKTEKCEEIGERGAKVKVWEIYHDTPVEVMRNMKSIERLYIYGYRDLAALPIDLRSVVELSVHGALPGVKSFRALRELRNFAVTGPLTSNEGFAIDGTNWIDELPRLVGVFIKGLKFQDAASLLKKPSIEWLEIESAGMTRIPRVVRDPNSPLDRLDLSKNEIRDVAALARFPVKTLILDDNLIEDLSPLAKNPYLESVTALGNPLKSTVCPIKSGDCTFIGDDFE